MVVHILPYSNHFLFFVHDMVLVHSQYIPLLWALFQVSHPQLIEQVFWFHYLDMANIYACKNKSDILERAPASENI